MTTQGIVPVILPFHILAGVLALFFGYVALYVAKGRNRNAQSGQASRAWSSLRLRANDTAPDGASQRA